MHLLGVLRVVCSKQQPPYVIAAVDGAHRPSILVLACSSLAEVVLVLVGVRMWDFVPAVSVRPVAVLAITVWAAMSI